VSRSSSALGGDHEPALFGTSRPSVRPLIVSTGMSTLDEVVAAVATIREAGDPPIALLHCLSFVPGACRRDEPARDGPLSARFGCPVGLSDHTTGIDIAIAAVARGATIVEKHLTLDKGLPGPDHRASLDPASWPADRRDPAGRVGAGRRGQATEAVGGRHAPGRPQEPGRRAADSSRRAAHARPDRDQAAGHRHLAGRARSSARPCRRACPRGDDVIDWAALGDA